jgi:hypothetical protein
MGIKLPTLLIAFVLVPILSAADKPTMKEITSKENIQEAQSIETQTTEAQTPAVDPINKLNLHSLGIGLGQTFLYGDFDNNGKDAITLDAYYTYSASYSFDMIANLHYSDHSQERYHSTISGLTVGIKSNLYHIDSLVPFAMGGFGFYLPTLKRESAEGLQPTDSTVAFGFHFGVGCDLTLNRHFAIGALAHYHNPFDLEQDNGADVEGSYIKLLMTTRYIF